VKRLVVVAATLVLCACGSAVPTYQAAGGPNSIGHFAAPAGAGRQIVTYTGNKDMSAAQVAEYALLRAAELTLESGHQWFAVIQTSSTRVAPTDINDIQGRSGSVLSTGATGAGTGGDRTGATAGVGDPSVPGGPSTGGFGGGDVPYQVIERWRPPTAYQSSIVIQMGSGKEANFEGLTKAPEIFSANDVAARIRAKMTK
jgi:hypothetical protein